MFNFFKDSSVVSSAAGSKALESSTPMWTALWSGNGYFLVVND